MEDRRTEKTMGRRRFLKTMGVAALGIWASTSSVSDSPVGLARAQLPEDYGSGGVVASRKESDNTLRKLRKLPFYWHVPTAQIGVYQSCINRAFELSPTLKFGDNDPRLRKLMDEAVHNDSLSQLNLELMMIQYVHADKHLREKYRTSWVEKVLNRKETDSFPDPWTVISAVFVKDR